MKIVEIKMSVAINKVLLEHRHAYSFGKKASSMAAFMPTGELSNYN